MRGLRLILVVSTIGIVVGLAIVVSRRGIYTIHDDNLNRIQQLSDAIQILHHYGVPLSELDTLEKVQVLSPKYNVFLTDYIDRDAWGSEWIFQRSLTAEFSLMILSLGKNKTFDAYCADDVWIRFDLNGSTMNSILYTGRTKNAGIRLKSPVVPRRGGTVDTENVLKKGCHWLASASSPRQSQTLK